MCKTFFSILKTKPGIAKTLAKELKRNGAGMAMNNDKAKMPKRIHHFSHQVGNNRVMKIEIPPNSTIRIERGIKAC